MPTIIIDGQRIECRPGIPILQAALEAGLNIPHYCYHPGLSVVASCRLCLMEMKMPHPQTRELDWAPKLFPSCQTPVRDGLEVRFNSERVRQNQKRVMEYYLLNHPLDCPVCDKAGECYLQDYAERFGEPTSRMVEDKHKNPKKDIGPRTLLYSDRCVLCGRCVRFAQEIAGTAELAVTNRASYNEIDVFPGRPLDNKLQGNVVDLCPVGALVSKDFLFKQRVWFLQDAKSVCPGCSRGCTVHVDQHENRVYRLRPRFNEKVNAWWMCDDGRFGFKYVHRDDRLNQPRIRRGAEWAPVSWEELPEILRFRFERMAKSDDGAAVAAVLSPMMSCEEAWLLARFIRDVAPQAALVPGPVPVEGEDEIFPKGSAGVPPAAGGSAGVPPASGFVIKAEKCPNRRGVERVIEHFGGATLTFGDFAAQAGESKYKAAYVVGGYPNEWVTKDCAKALAKVEFLVVHDLFASPLDATATVQIPSASWVEREGSFMNCDGLLQPFERAIVPLEGVKADGQFLYELCGERGLFRAARVREAMAAAVPSFGEVHVPRDPPRHAH